MIEKPKPAPADDDLFGGEKPSKPAAEPPAAAPEEPATPAQKQPEEVPEPVPSPKTPEQGDEDLFDDRGAPAVVKPAPAKPAAAEPEEDLFSPEVEPKKENRQPADEPAEEPTSPTPAEDKPAREKNEGKADEAEEDPFAGILQTPDEPMRIWIDDTGRHRTVARLVEVRPEGVRLLKANGRFSNVPFSRLSDHDRLYATATASRVETQFVQQPKPNDTAGL